MKTEYVFASPLWVKMAGYPVIHSVSRICRERNKVTGKVLTLAEATWRHPGGLESTVTDYLTMMRLADRLHKIHGLPINPRYEGQQLVLLSANGDSPYQPGNAVYDLGPTVGGMPEETARNCDAAAGC